MNFFWTSHFSGCGGSTLGAIAAGFIPISAIECNPAIADLYQANIGDVFVEDITKVDPRKLNIPMPGDRSNHILIMQTSPECTKFSKANTAARANYEEALKSKSAQLLKYTYQHYQMFKPEYVVLENVPDYRHADVYKDFEEFLISIGYRVFKGIFNTADYGVPQTRQRFIAIAVKDGYPVPQMNPTHSNSNQGQLSLFSPPLQKWIGWYQAIADLIPELPESTLTKKQQQALRTFGWALVDGQNSTSVNGTYKSRSGEDTCFTLGCNAQAKIALVERIGYYKYPKIAEYDQPCWVIRASLGGDNKKNEGNRNKVIDAVVASGVRSLNVQAIARLQSFPDTYKWSGKMSVDVRGIGNSIPPLFMQRICEAIRDACRR